MKTYWQQLKNMFDLIISNNYCSGKINCTSFLRVPHDVHVQYLGQIWGRGANWPQMYCTCVSCSKLTEVMYWVKLTSFIFGYGHRAIDIHNCFWLLELACLTHCIIRILLLCLKATCTQMKHNVQTEEFSQ